MLCTVSFLPFRSDILHSDQASPLWKAIINCPSTWNWALSGFQNLPENICIFLCTTWYCYYYVSVSSIPCLASCSVLACCYQSVHTQCMNQWRVQVFWKILSDFPRQILFYLYFVLPNPARNIHSDYALNSILCEDKDTSFNSSGLSFGLQSHLKVSNRNMFGSLLLITRQGWWKGIFNKHQDYSVLDLLIMTPCLDTAGHSFSSLTISPLPHHQGCTGKKTISNLSVIFQILSHSNLS